MENPSATPQPDPSQNPQVGQQVAMSNADDSRNGVPVVNQAPAYGDPGQPKAPAQPAPTPAQQHTGWFHNMMTRMNQGDQQVVRDRNGNPVMGPDGKPQTQPLTSKQMGRSILAGVLSAMAATEQHQPYRNGNGIWVNPSNEATQAGQQAFQAGRPKQQFQQASDDLNKQRTQQYATYEANLKMLTQTQQLYQLKGQQMTAAVDHYKDLTDQLQQGGVTNPETGESVFDPNYANMTPQEMEDHIKKGDFTKDLAWPVGVEPVMDDKGVPTGRSQLRWAAIKGPANIHINDAMKKEFPTEFGSASSTQTIPLLQYLKMVRTKADASALGSMIQNVNDTQVEEGMKGAKPMKFDWDQFRKDARLTPDQMHQMHGMAGLQPDEFMAKIRQMDTAQGGAGRLAEALSKQGITVDDKAWAEKRSVEAAEEKAKNARAAKQQDLLTAPLTDSLAEDIQAEYESAKDHNGIPDARYAAATAFSTNKANRKAAAEQTAADIKKNAEVDKDGLDDAADAIVNGGSLGKMSDFAAMGRSPAKTYLGNAIRKAAIAAGKDPQFYSPAAMEQKAKTYGEFTSAKNGSVGANIVAFDNYLGHTGEAMDAVERLKGQMIRKTLGSVPIIDQPISWLDKHVTANEDYARFQAALVPVKKEFEAFLNNNRAEHTEDLQEMSRLLNDTNQSPNQIINHLKEMTKSADVRLAGMGRKFQASMHQNFDDLVTPQGADVMKRMGVDSLALRGNANYKPPQGNRSTPPPPPPGFGPVAQPQQQPQ